MANGKRHLVWLGQLVILEKPLPLQHGYPNRFILTKALGGVALQGI